MTPSVLSAKDVTVLAAINDGDSITEIVLSSRLIPSEVQATLDRLRAKNLIQYGPASVVQLTTKGRLFKKQLKRGDSRVLVTDDEETLDSTQIEKALTASINQLS